MKTTKSKKILTTLSTIVGLAFTLTKIADLYQRIKARATAPSREAINESHLDYERKLAAIREDHLRNKLEIKRDYAQQKESEHAKQVATGPLPPKTFASSSYGKSWEDLRLFGSAIHSGNKGVIIAPKGVGKTALTMFLSTAFAEGKPTGLWPAFADGKCPPQRVLYYDCELTDTDMNDRYYKYGYQFPKNFERYDQSQFRGVDEILSDLQWKVENQMVEGDEVVSVIDNITKTLKTEQVSEINRFNEKVDEIYNLARQRGVILTMIIIVHVLTGEYRPGTALSLRDAAGGSNLTNFADFIITIEKPKAGNKTIIVKILNSRGEPEPDNVCVLRRVGKDEGTYYHFEYVGEMPEQEALKGVDDATEEADSPKVNGRGCPWTSRDDEQLRELSATLDEPYADIIGDIMHRAPAMIGRHAKALKINLPKRKSGRKPKQKEQANEE